MFNRIFNYCMSLLLLSAACMDASINQTDELSPIRPGSELPFEIQIGLADFQLPNGLHSGVVGFAGNNWLFLAGRTNGLHGFENDDFNFPPRKQNTTVYVVDPINKVTYSRSLTGPGSGLTQHEVDLLSVTSPQYYQVGSTLYMTGGYGVDTETGNFSTKDSLIAINVPVLMQWVMNPFSTLTAADCIRRTSSPIFKITGGAMFRVNPGLSLLVFGQNFQGFYNTNSNGEYSEQVRRFKIHDNGEELSVESKGAYPVVKNPNFRRRDLNVVPVVRKKKGHTVLSYVALSGVFTEAGGIWTVPVTITADGQPSMADPNLETTFKQGMNNYASPTVKLFSKKDNASYTIILGGITFEFFKDGGFETDNEIPFTNQVTTVKMDKNQHFTQYLMDAEYPFIPTQPNSDKPLLFGAGGYFIPLRHLPFYPNGVIKMDHLKKGPILLGFVVGGIQSKEANTATQADSAASPYIFPVYLTKKK